MLWKQELAVPSAISRNTSAHVAVVSLVAGCTIVAGVVFTAANGGATVAASVPWRAGAGVATQTLLARSAILARICAAFISCVVAVHSGETVGALAQIRVYKIHTTCT